jgi:hypothetical protein
MDRGEESGNPNQVDWVRQEYDSDRRTDWVTRDSRGNRDGYSGRWVDRVTQDSRCNQDYDSGQRTDWVTRVSRGNRDSNTKLGNSSRVTENLANTKKPGYGEFDQHGEPGYGEFV